MHSELEEAVRRCSTCQEAQSAQQKEPLMTPPLPKTPWQVVATDCFELDRQHYCVLVGTYSDYIEVFPLQDMTTESLVKQLKPVFATHGIPLILFSDNGPNYASHEFAEFAEDWDFEHVTSSPYHSKSNGKAESAVKIAKGIIKKANKDGKDMWKALLEWRNTQTPGMDSSPAQRLMSRRTRSFLPCKNTLYYPQVVDAVKEAVVNKRQVAKFYHDRSARTLPDLVVGQPIRAKTRPKVMDSPWVPGVVATQVAPQSYRIDF
jgi:hypothetical protein